jgi:predicted nuclease with RNAse H fold
MGTNTRHPRVVIGIDVGAPRKGFHAVALFQGTYHAVTASSDPQFIANWCRELDVGVIAIDAPCAWSTPERGREAERALRRRGLNCFVTPTLEQARSHPKGWYDWMLAGAALYEALAATHPRFDGTRRERVSIETFPHAIACALAGEYVPAKDKARTRRALLDALPVDTRALKSIDQIDAALCAWTAHVFAQGRTECLGDAESGFIVTPPLPGTPRQEPGSKG